MFFLKKKFPYLKIVFYLVLVDEFTASGAEILAGALQGAGDTKSPMYSTALGMWVIRIIGVYILGIHFGMGIAGIWISIAIDLYARGAFLFYQFSKHFKKIEEKNLGVN